MRKLKKEMKNTRPKNRRKIPRKPNRVKLEPYRYGLTQEEIADMQKRSAHDASRLSPKSAVDVRSKVLVEGPHEHLFLDFPIWEGTLCYLCEQPLNGQRLHVPR